MKEPKLKDFIDLKVLKESIQAEHCKKLAKAENDLDQKIIDLQYGPVLRTAAKEAKKISEKEIQQTLVFSHKSFFKSFVSPYFKIKNLSNKSQIAIKAEIEGIGLILLFNKGELIYVYMDLEKLFQQFTFPFLKYDDYFWLFNHQLTFSLCNLLTSDLIWEYLPLINEYYKFVGIEPSDINFLEDHFTDSSKYHCFYCFKRLKSRSYFCSEQCNGMFLDVKKKVNKKEISFPIHRELILFKKDFDEILQNLINKAESFGDERDDSFEDIWNYTNIGEYIKQSHFKRSEVVINTFTKYIQGMQEAYLLEAEEGYNPPIIKRFQSWINDGSVIIFFKLLGKEIKSDIKENLIPNCRPIRIEFSKRGNYIRIKSLKIEHIKNFTIVINEAIKIAKEEEYEPKNSNKNTKEKRLASISEEYIRVNKFKFEDLLLTIIKELSQVERKMAVFNSRIF